MKSASSALITLFNSNQQFIPADLFEITLVSGAVIRYTSRDSNIVDGGNTYLANNVLIERSRIRSVLGIEVATLDLVVNPHPNDMVSGVTFLKSCVSGQLDGARLILRRAFLDVSGTNVGSLIAFSGRVSGMSATRTEVNMTISSDFELLNIKLPLNLFQSTCLNTLYDGDCTLNRASFGTNFTASGVSSNTITASLSQAAGYFNLGYVLATSGPNNGLRRTVKSYSVGSIVLLSQFPNAVSTGDTFTAYAGCDKTQATCTSKFNNVINFRAFPYIPVPETTR